MTYIRSSWVRPGASELPLYGTATPLDPDSYHGSVRRVDLGSVVVDVLAVAAHRYERTSADVASMPHTNVVVMAIGDGTICGTIGDLSFTLARGDVVVFDDGQTLGYSSPGPVRMLRIEIDAVAVPDYLLDSHLLPYSRIPRTKLVNSAVAFFSAMFSRNEKGAADDDVSLNPHLRGAILDLGLAVLAEARNAMRTADPQQDLRMRIETYVIEHLRDADLAPTAVARALGISVRYVHQVFNRDGLTLARFIRERRLDEVAAALRDGDADLQLSALGTRLGFGSRDQLSRGFRQRFGSTMGDYRAAHAHVSSDRR